MTALIVRTEPGAGAFVQRLSAAGIPAVACPVTTIHPLDTPFGVPATAQAVMFTSANAVRCYDGRNGRTDLPAFAVGASTAEAAAAVGFATVHSADSDVRGLAALVAARCRPSQGEVIYPAAREVSGKLTATLQARGFSVSQTALYEARGASMLPAAAVNAFRTRTIAAAALFSVRNALEFGRLIVSAGHTGAVSGMYACCISDAVAAAFGDVAGLPAAKESIVAASPDADAMAALLGTLHGR